MNSDRDLELGVAASDDLDVGNDQFSYGEEAQSATESVAVSKSYQAEPKPPAAAETPGSYGILKPLTEAERQSNPAHITGGRLLGSNRKTLPVNNVHPLNAKTAEQRAAEAKEEAAIKFASKEAPAKPIIKRTGFAKRVVDSIWTKLAKRAKERAEQRKAAQKAAEARLQEFIKVHTPQMPNTEGLDPVSAGAQELLFDEKYDEFLIQKQKFIDKETGIVQKFKNRVTESAVRALEAIKPRYKKTHTAAAQIVGIFYNRKNSESQRVFDAICRMAVDYPESNWYALLEINLKNSYLWNEDNLDRLTRLMRDPKLSYDNRVRLLAHIGTMLRGNIALVTPAMSRFVQPYMEASENDYMRSRALRIRHDMLAAQPAWKSAGYAESMLELAGKITVKEDDVKGVDGAARDRILLVQTRTQALNGFESFLKDTLAGCKSPDERKAKIELFEDRLYDIAQKDLSQSVRLQAIRIVGKLLAAHDGPVDLHHIQRLLEVAKLGKEGTNEAALKCAFEVLERNIKLDPTTYAALYNEMADEIGSIARPVLKGRARMVRNFEIETGLQVPGFVELVRTNLEQVVDFETERKKKGGKGLNAATISSVPDMATLQIENTKVLEEARDGHTQATGTMHVQSVPQYLQSVMGWTDGIVDDKSRAMRMPKEICATLVQTMMQIPLRLRGIQGTSAQVAQTALEIVQMAKAAKYKPLQAMPTLLCTANYIESLIGMRSAETSEVARKAAMKSVLGLLDFAGAAKDKNYVKAMDALANQLRNSDDAVDPEALRMLRNFQAETGIPMAGFAFSRVDPHHILTKTTGVYSVETTFIDRKEGNVVVRVAEVEGKNRAEKKTVVEQSGDVVEVFRELANAEGALATLAVRELIPGLYSAVFDAASQNISNPEVFANIDNIIDRLETAVNRTGNESLKKQFFEHCRVYDMKKKTFQKTAEYVEAGRQVSLPVAEKSNVVSLFGRAKNQKTQPAVQQEIVRRQSAVASRDTEIADSNFFTAFEPKEKALKTVFIPRKATADWTYTRATAKMVAHIQGFEDKVRKLDLWSKRAGTDAKFAQKKAATEAVIKDAFDHSMASLAATTTAVGDESKARNEQNWSSGVMVLMQRTPELRTEQNMLKLIGIASASDSEALKLKVARFVANAATADGDLRKITILEAAEKMSTEAPAERTATNSRGGNGPKLKVA